MSTMTNHFEVIAESASLAPLRKKLKSVFETGGFDDKMIHEILLSVDEVLTNVIRHGCGVKSGQSGKEKINISILDNGDRVEILVEDRRPCFDPRTIPAPKLPLENPGGLGIHFVRSLMDEVDYEALRPQGNRLRLVKYKKKKERNSEP